MVVALLAHALSGCTPGPAAIPRPEGDSGEASPEVEAVPWLYPWVEVGLNGYVNDLLFRALGNTWLAYIGEVCQLEGEPFCAHPMDEYSMSTPPMDLLAGEGDDELWVTAFGDIAVLHEDYSWTSAYEGWDWELGQVQADFPLAGPPRDLHALARDEYGRVYTASSAYNMIWRFDDDGVARAVAGVGGLEGYSGDGGPAVEAELALRHWGLSYRGRLAIDGHWLYIADSQNYVVRRVDLDTGIIELFAGIPGQSATLDDAPDRTVALETLLNIPVAVTVEPNGELLVVERECVRRIHADGTMTKVLGRCGWNEADPCEIAREGPAEDLCLDGILAAEYDLEGRLNLVTDWGAWVLLDGPPEEAR